MSMLMRPTVSAAPPWRQLVFRSVYVSAMADELLPQTKYALLYRISKAQAEGRAPSLVAAVVRDGEPVWFGSRSCVDGHAPDDDTQYRIGSISKTFVAVQVMKLRDEGRLDLTDPLEKHLPGTAIGDARIGELLAHTAGLASESAGQWWERVPGEPSLAAALGTDPMRHPAGRRFHYSNPGFGALGALVAQLRGSSWPAALLRDVLEPLGLTRTTPMPVEPHAGGWAVHPWADVLLPEPAEDAGPMAPAGQLWSTTRDMCRWATFLASGHPSVLAEATLEEMRELASPGDRTGGYGLGLQVLYDGDRTLAGHTGSMPGFLAAVWASVDERLSGVVMVNTTSGVQIGSLAADLVRIVAEHEPSLPAPWRPLPEYDSELLELTGPWYWGPTSYGLHLLADRGLELRPLRGNGRASRFRAQPDGTWLGLDNYYAGERLRVVRDESGAVTHLDLGTFIFTRSPYDPDAPVPGGVDPAGWRGLPS
jgi:CubicO group peptidase (beta-lactamase class C family)